MTASFAIRDLAFVISPVRCLAVMNLPLRGTEADLVDTALLDRAFPQSEAISQVMS
jgi:hypothetical protein